MILLLIFIILLIGGIILQIKLDARDRWNDNIAGSVIAVISAIVVSLLLAGLYCSREGDKRFIAQLNATRHTILNSRIDSISPLERVELQKTIIETNKDIANRKYDNQSQWDYWTIDEVDTLQYLK